MDEAIKDANEMKKLFKEIKITDQWSAEEIKSYDNLQTKDQKFEWTHERENCVILNMFGYDFNGTDKFMNLLLLREKVSKDLKTYVSAHTLQKYINSNKAKFDKMKNFSIKKNEKHEKKEENEKKEKKKIGVEAKKEKVKPTPFKLPVDYNNEIDKLIESEIQEEKCK